MLRKLKWTRLITRTKQIAIILFVAGILGALVAGKVNSEAWSITYAARNGTGWETHVLDANHRISYATNQPIDLNSTEFISPDGRYVVDYNARQQLQISDIQTGQVLAALTTGYNPSWSPDSHALIYYRFGQYAIINYVTIANNGTVSAPSRLTDDSAFETYNVSWSPDGQSIAFQGTVYGGEAGIGLDVYRIDLGAPQSLRNLSYSRGSDVQPAWSPDGTQIAYVSNREANQRLYLVAPDGSNLREITTDTSLVLDLAWSPDGTKLAYVNLLDGFHHLHIVDVADGYRISPPLIVTQLDVDSTLQWSPDGERVAFSTLSGEIYAVNLDGSNLHRLISGFGRENLFIP